MALLEYLVGIKSSISEVDLSLDFAKKTLQNIMPSVVLLQAHIDLLLADAT